MHSPSTPKQKKPETEYGHQRANVFYGVQWLTMAALAGGVYGSLRFFGMLNYDFLHGNPILLLWLLVRTLWGLATLAGTLTCRRFGLSLDGTKVETIGKPQAFKQGRTIDYPAVDDSRVPGDLVRDNLVQTTPNQIEALHGPRSTLAPFVINRGCSAFILPVCTTLICAICTGPPLYANLTTSSHFTRHPEYVLLLTLTFAVSAATAILTWKNVRQPELRADARGITFCDAVGLSSRFVSWEHIQSVEIQTKRDVFGVIKERVVLLRDEQHHKLARLFFSSGTVDANRANIDRFINHIAVRFTGQRHFPEVALEPLPPQPAQPSPVPKREVSDVTLVVEFGANFVEVKVPAYYRLLVSVTLAVISILFLRWNEKTETVTERLIVEGVPMLFFLGTLITIPFLHFTAVRLRADARGFAQRTGFFYTEKVMPWPSLSTAELELKRDANGCVIARHLVLKDQNSQVSVKANVTDLSLVQSERLLVFVQDKLTGP